MYRRRPLKWQKHDPAMFENYQSVAGDECQHQHQNHEPQPSTSGQQSKKSSKNKNN
ncbi:signal peptidase complex subunit 1-like protein [Euroglyphus maynei]|uniref:Signal peptidase complex subunit 1-like protein n=1 Tax=Euroglyphus maynei TaxID=6958 RepID=A0A1Y3BA41_EURMA|nr:signal peptidase complex subunit 1-like protein [Euroglyphus maynei]